MLKSHLSSWNVLLFAFKLQVLWWNGYQSVANGLHGHHVCDNSLFALTMPHATQAECSLGWAWASPTLAWLHCGSVCACTLVCLFGLTTLRLFVCLFGPKFQMSAFKYFMMIACPRWRAPQLSLSRENEYGGLLSDCRFGVKESKSKDDWMCWQHAQQLTW